MASTPCANKALMTSLRFCAGEIVAPGVRTRIFFVDYDDIVKWPELPKVATAKMSEIATYKGDFTLAADKKWLVIDLVNNKGQIEWETQGEGASRLFLNKMTIHHATISADAAGLQRQFLGRSGVFLVQQRDGAFRVLGCEGYRPEITPKGSTGEGVTGEMGTKLEISATDFAPAPYYVGKITTEDGDISAATGAAVVP